ncbi:hypothetical protein C7S17_4485 [Burkholderia thailandensis]|nr:hypothetical protein [Burkholderia thailandensis]
MHNDRYQKEPPRSVNGTWTALPPVSVRDAPHRRGRAVDSY